MLPGGVKLSRQGEEVWDGVGGGAEIPPDGDLTDLLLGYLRLANMEFLC